MTRKTVPLLIDEQPILVYPSLAKVMGINKAVVFQQLHFLLNSTITAANINNYVDGQWWVYNTYEQWREHYFPWLSLRSLKTYFLELEDAGFITSIQSVKNKSDRKKWYTINYDKWNTYVADTMGQKLHDGSTGKNCTMVVQEMHDGYTDTTTDTTTDKKEEKQASSDAAPSKPKKTSTPKKSQPYDDVPQPVRTEIIAAWVNSLEALPIENVYANRTNHTKAAEIHRAGYTAYDVARYVKILQKDKFWTGKHIPLTTICKNMPAWLRTHPDFVPSKPPMPAPKTDEPEYPVDLAAKQTWEDLLKKYGAGGETDVAASA